MPGTVTGKENIAGNMTEFCPFRDDIPVMRCLWKHFVIREEIDIPNNDQEFLKTVSIDSSPKILRCSRNRNEYNNLLTWSVFRTCYSNQLSICIYIYFECSGIFFKHQVCFLLQLRVIFCDYNLNCLWESSNSEILADY